MLFLGESSSSSCLKKAFCLRVCSHFASLSGRPCIYVGTKPVQLHPKSIGIAVLEENKPMMMMMMRGMTANNFDPIRYSGRWFDVASLKRGFDGQGQEDCHYTQGVYSFDMKEAAIKVDTFCVHGSPDGYITGIRGKVQCVGLDKSETGSEKREMIKDNCFLRFPTIPFIPKLPYDVIATNYDNYTLVSGAKDRGFVQVYSRSPNPGPEFIAKYKNYLAQFGYDLEKIKDTPHDCEVMSDGCHDVHARYGANADKPVSRSWIKKISAV